MRRLPGHQAHSQPLLTKWTPDKVTAAPDPVLAFAAYTQQHLGVPWPTLKDIRILRHKINIFFDRYPHCDYKVLCKVVDWCRSTNHRYGRVWRLLDDGFRQCFESDALPELLGPTVDDNVEDRIAAALATETDPWWRARLIGVSGVEARTRAINEWETEHAPRSA